ncbi:MAG: GerMN domain-containing protein [Clostridia bacterium]|nr:GerMN domain-containing protein [Clostridia bacterium]
MKKIVICVLCLALLLSGCAVSQTEKEPIRVTLSPFEMPQEQPQWITLYYPSEDKSRVLSYNKQMSRSDSLYEDIMTALLTSTQDYKSPFPSSVSCRSIMLTQNVLYIDLSQQFLLQEVQDFYACLSVLAETYCGLKEIDFINITVEGRQLFAPESNGNPIMFLSEYSGSISDMVAQHNERANNSSDALESLYCAVYVADPTGQFLLPQVKNLVSNKQDLGITLLRTLISSDESTFADGFLVQNLSARNETLAVELICPKDFEQKEGWLGPKAIACTLNSIYPDCKKIAVTVKDSSGAEIFSLQEDTTGSYNYIRSGVEVFIPDSSKKSLAKASMLVTNVPGSGDLTGFMNDYVYFVSPALKEKGKMVLDVNIYNDTVIIDLSEKYFAFHSPLDAREEYALVYSLISTACAFSGTNKAILLQDKQTRSTFGGSIVLSKALTTLPEEYLSSIK